MKAAKLSDKTEIADDEKKPSMRSKLLALLRQSEKKPTGSQALRVLNRRLGGHMMSPLSILNEAIGAKCVVIVVQVIDKPAAGACTFSFLLFYCI